MLFKRKKQPVTVDSLVADIHEKVSALHDVGDQLADESDMVGAEIQVLEDQISQLADQQSGLLVESGRAHGIADNFARLLEVDDVR